MANNFSVFDTTLKKIILIIFYVFLRIYPIPGSEEIDL